MVSAFFKNIAQKMTLIELLQNRAAIQEESGNEMRARFEAYSLELQEVLIGTPRAAAGDRTIEDILIQLRSRQVAREQVTTFQEQEKAAVQERTLNEAKATAAAQIALTQSLIQVKVHENEGAAALAQAQKDAETVKVTAAAAGERSRLEGKGEADRTLAIGTANAQATKLSVDAYGGPRISFGRTKLLALRRRLDQDQSTACAAISNVRRAGRENYGGLIPTAMLSSMFGRMMPPLEPPAVRPGCQGLRVRPCSELAVCMRSAMSGRLVRPIGIAPAARIRSTTGASAGTTAWASAGTPQVVGRPAMSIFSFTVNGTPCKGPSFSPAASSRSAESCASARLVGEHADHGVQPRVDGIDAGEGAHPPLQRSSGSAMRNVVSQFAG